MELSGWLALAGLVVGSGAGAGLLKFVVGHARKHQEIDDRLGSGKESFARNEADHREILGVVRAIGGKVDRVDVAVREVLVAVGERKPGVGLNGHEKPGGA